MLILIYSSALNSLCSPYILDVLHYYIYTHMLFASHSCSLLRHPMHTDQTPIEISVSHPYAGGYRPGSESHVSPKRGITEEERGWGLRLNDTIDGKQKNRPGTRRVTRASNDTVERAINPTGSNYGKPRGHNRNHQ